MNIARIANVAMTVLAVSLLFACQKVKEAETDPSENVTFSVALNSKEATYAEVVVRHTGTDSQSWYGFVTTDINSSEEDLIKAQLPQVNSKNLHVGKSQTVAVPNIEALGIYRYIAFGTDKDGKRYGTPGSLVFTSSPDYDVTFVTEVESLDSHSATINITHDGNEVLTYRGILTSDMESETSDIIAKDYSDIVKNGKLEEVLLSGTSNSIELKELTHETDYRYIVYGVYVEDEVAVYYGTPAESTFTTPIDLSLVSFSATVSGITTETAKVSVKYDAKQEDLTWYGFVSTDLTTPAETLIADAVESITADDYLSGAQQNLDIENLQMETEYRYIATGINSDGVYGIPADVRFTTLSQAYLNTVFSVVASDITTTGATLTITHTGEEEFKYYGFFTEDMDSELADVEVPANADNNLVSGKEKVITVDNLKPLTAYRYVVVGRVYGNEYGTRGEVKFETADPAVPMTYEDYLGKWIVDEITFTISQNVNGVSFKIDNLPGASSVKNGNSTVIAQYDSDKGQLYVMEQDLGQYNDTSYGPVGEYFSGAYLVTLNSGNQSQWPSYPFQSSVKQKIFSFVKYDDGSYVIRSENEEFETALFNWRILSGQYKGAGNIYNPYITLPSTVEKAPEATEAYNAWLGTWYIPTNVYQFDASGNYTGDEVQVLPITISEKVVNQSYLISGISPENDKYDVLVEFSANGTLSAAGQTVYTWNHSSAGEINERFVGYYGEGEDTYYTWEGSVVFTGKVNSNGTATLTPGTTNSGNTYNGFGFKQCYVQNGQNVSYGYGGDYDLPNTLTRTATTSVPAVSGKAPRQALPMARRMEAPAQFLVK